MATQQSTCVNCNITGLPVFPAIYAVIPEKLKPKLPPGISGDRVTGLNLKGSALPDARYDYGLRVCRQGYVYVFYEKGALGGDYWETYTVNGDGSLRLQRFYNSPDAPEDTLSCNTPGHLAQRVQYFVIEAPEECGTVWVAYSQHRWSHDKLTDYATKPELRARRMQSIQPNQWTKSAKPTHKHAVEATPKNLAYVQDYILNIVPALTPSHVPEFSQADGSYELASFVRQSSRYPANARVGTELPLVQQMHVSGARPDGEVHPPMLLALWDAIGITHELNGFRNEVSGRVTQYQEQERSMQICTSSLIESAVTALSHAESVRLSEQEMREHIKLQNEYSRETAAAWRKAGAATTNPILSAHYDECADLLDQWDAQDVMANFRNRLASIVTLANQGDWNGTGAAQLKAKRDSDLAQLKADVDRYLKQRTTNRHNAVHTRPQEMWDKHCKPHLDMTALGTFRSNYEKFLNFADALRVARTNSLIKWLESELLKDTLEDYDKNAPTTCGVAFEEVVATAIFGIGDCKAGAKKIDRWIEEMKSTPTNLLWRAIGLNNDKIQDEVDHVLAMAFENKFTPFTEKEFDKALKHISAIKSAADAYKKAVSVSNTNFSALSAKGSKAFDVAIKPSPTGRVDIMLIAVGDRIFKWIGVGKAGNFVGEKMVLWFLGIRSAVNAEDSATFIKSQAAEQLKLMQEAELRAVRASTSVTREQMARVQGMVSPKEYARIQKRVTNQEARTLMATAERQTSSVAQKMFELEAEARANPKSPMSQAWNKFLNDPSKADDISKAHKDVRLATVVMLIESINLVKIVAWDVDWRGKTDNSKSWGLAGASLLSVTAGALDIWATVAKSGLGAEARTYQWLKLGGGLASCASSSITAFFDWDSARKEVIRGNWTMAALYVAKVGLGGLSVGATAFTTFTYSAGLAGRIVGGEPARLAVSRFGLRSAAAVIGRRVLFMVGGMWFTAAMVGVHILVIWLDDAELTKWCKRCHFALGRDPESYSDIAKQTAAFYAALFEAA